MSRINSADRLRPRWRTRSLNLAAAAVAMLALIAMVPALVRAQTVVLSPNSATNFVGQNHTVTAQLFGVCEETGGGNDGDGEGTACTSDADCAALDSGGADDICAISASNNNDINTLDGLPIWIGVTAGPNNGTTNATALDANGQATLTYTSAVEGVDTISGCLDLDTTAGNPDESTGTAAGDLAMCLNDSPGEGDLAATSTVSKTWEAALDGMIVLSPTAAINTVTNPAGAHTVTATVTGVARCIGGTNDGTICADSFACTGGGTCTDKSGLTVGFEIASGPNAGDYGFTATNASGQATLTYADNGGAGLDEIQGCLDQDTSAPGFADENTPLVSECIADAGTEGANADVASNTVSKRWDPSLMLQNLDAGASLAAGSPVFTTSPAFNPVGTTHTVRAMVSGAANICFGGTAGSNAYSLCKTDADCTDGGTCGIAGYPVFFGVLAGSQNAGDLPGPVLTDSNGKASITYTDTNGAGVDTIQSCVDADLTDGVLPDDTSFTECLTDYPTQADIPSNTVMKTWLARFVTGGGKVSTGPKSWDSFGGVVGQKPNSTAVMGEWQEVAHQAKGGNIQCHWSAFSAFALSCSNKAGCGANPDTVVFTTTNIGGSCGSETVTIVAPTHKSATILVQGAASPALNVSPATPISGGFTIHP